MHIGKLIARMNPTTVRYDVGHGGIPERTSQDIAAALGMCGSGALGTVLLELAWGDPTRAVIERAGVALEEAQRAEWWRREEDMQTAVLAVASHTGGDSLRRAQAQYQVAHAHRWPQFVAIAELGTHAAGYARVRLGVLAEIRSPLHCHACDGRGEVGHAEGVVRACTICRGTGHAEPSDASRARLLQISAVTYARTWRAVYEWTRQTADDAMREASAQVHAALA